MVHPWFAARCAPAPTVARVRARRLTLSSALTAALLALATPAVAAGGDAPAGPARPAPYPVLQMNLCLSGLAGCYPGTRYPAVVEEAVATIRAVQPRAVTLNEACSGDVERIAARTGMEHRFATVLYRGAPLPCVKPGGRGVFGNAVLVRDRITASEERAFAAQLGPEERRWLCASTDAGVRVCTSHLSVAGTEAQAATNEAQCAELRDVLAAGPRREPVVFGGDVNRQDGCAPAGSWTLRDDEATQAPGIQHVYGSRGGLLQPHAQVVPMAHTDHDALVARARLNPAAGGR